VATRKRVALQQSRRHPCAALADPEVLGDLVEAGAKKQMPVKPGGDGRNVPRCEQPSHILYEPLPVLA
jgi:hypothetical protein